MFRSLFTIDGRLGRLDYAKLTFLSMVMLIIGVFSITMPLVASQLSGGQTLSVGLGVIAGVLFVIVGLWSAVACSIRRMRDMGYNPLWLGLCFVPLKEVAVLAIFGLTMAMSFMPGRDDADDYGSSPRATD